MARRNTPSSFGWVAKSFHWLTALLILSAFPLGYFAHELAYKIQDPNIATTDADIAQATLLFSAHKTVGVAVFFVALLRILWATTQPKPGLLNGDKPLEAWAAETAHWLLYGSLVAVPLSGWVHHAATTGFAPIWWPFGQNLPFVPKDPVLADLTGTLHFVLMLVLGAALAAHIAGALKHHVIDRDGTLRRMLPGRPVEDLPSVDQPGHFVPMLTALAIWAAVLGGAAWQGWFKLSDQAQAAELQATNSEWQVQDGSLEIVVRQMGSDVVGSFADWTADISFSEAPDAGGKHGAVTVTVGIASLTLGSVTDQAKGPDYFDLEKHPTATFTADILAAEAGYVAKGTLTIKDQTVPLSLPFDLSIADGIATASGSINTDRRDYLIGMGTTDEGSLAFNVEIRFTLTAQKPSDG